MVKTRQPEDEKVKKSNGNPADTPPSDPIEESPCAVDVYLEDGYPDHTSMDPWHYMQLLAPEQWDEISVYLYRAHPRTMRVAGKPSYLDVFSGPITIEEVKDKFGGGVFEIFIKRGKAGVYQKYAFTIEGKPKFSEGEKPEGKDADEKAAAASAVQPEMMAMFRELMSDVIEQRDRAQKTGQQFDVNSAIAQALSMQSKASDAVIEMVTQKAKNLMSGSGGGSVLEILGALKNFGLIGQQQPARNFVEEMKTMLGFIREMRELEPEAPAAAGGDWKSEMARTLAGNAPALLDRVGNIMKDYRAAQEAVTARMLVSQGYRVRTIPPTAPQSGAPPTAATPSEPPTQPTPAGPQAGNEQDAAMMDFCKHKIIQMLNDGEDGGDAALVVDKLHPRFAEELAHVLQTNPAILAGDAILSQAAQNPRLPQFGREYVDYFVGEEAPEPTPGKGGSRKVIEMPPPSA